MAVFTKKLKSLLNFARRSNSRGGRRQYTQLLVQVDVVVLSVVAQDGDPNKMRVCFKLNTQPRLVQQLQDPALITTNVSNIPARDHFNHHEIVVTYQASWNAFAGRLSNGQAGTATGLLYFYQKNGRVQWSIDPVAVVVK